jgi:CRP-like cAMP-binding protein
MMAAGSEPDGALLIRSGVSRLHVRSGAACLYAGSVRGPALLGVGWALRERGAPFDVVAAGHVTTVLVPTARLLAAVRASPSAALSCALAIDEMSMFCERAVALAAAPLRSRIAHVLLEDCPLQHTGHWSVSRTHRQIAECLGTARQCVSRVLKDLERDRVVRCRYGEIVVLDVPALRAVSPW